MRPSSLLLWLPLPPVSNQYRSVLFTSYWVFEVDIWLLDQSWEVSVESESNRCSKYGLWALKASITTRNPVTVAAAVRDNAVHMASFVLRWCRWSILHWKSVASYCGSCEDIHQGEGTDKFLYLGIKVRRRIYWCLGSWRHHLIVASDPNTVARF